MSRLDRRRFLQSAAASTLFSSFVIGGTKASGRVIGANDRIRMAVCGINGRGKDHIQGFAKIENVEVSYLVDPDSRLFSSRSDMVLSLGGNKPQCVQDVREMLDDRNIDAISVATCNHWHSLMSIWACQAGKDVYVEKPLSHNVWEGRQLVAAAKGYKRIVQHGTQQRSNQERADQMSAIHSERYGKLLVSKGYCCKERWSIGTKPTAKPPAELDFNLWLGPAPEQEYHENLVHYNWHWFWDTGNGDTGNQGVHEMDVARWAIKGATLPTQIWSLGGRLGYEDQGQTPNMQLTVFTFGDVLLVFETRGLVNRHPGWGVVVRNEFYTTEGVIRDGQFYPHKGGDPQPVQPEPSLVRQVTPGGSYGSFITAVRDRQPERCNCDAEVGHYSSALCHLANISYRLGERVPFNSTQRVLGDNTQVVESFEKIRENCQTAGMKLEEHQYMLGRTLQFDPETEQFANDPQANSLLSRPYRRPFEVPKLA